MGSGVGTWLICTSGAISAIGALGVNIAKNMGASFSGVRVEVFAFSAAGGLPPNPAQPPVNARISRAWGCVFAGVCRLFSICARLRLSARLGAVRLARHAFYVARPSRSTPLKSFA